MKAFFQLLGAMMGFLPNAMFGWLDRLNDTLSIPLEDEPTEFANVHLTPHGCAGKGHIWSES